MTISVITPTADQPKGMALLEKYVARQTVRPDQWIVADDGDQPATLTAGQTHLVEKRQHEGGRSLASNMLRALEQATGDIIVVLEHDDHYAPDHIETCVKQLERSQATGADTLRYYNVELRGWKPMKNGRGMSALCNTAFHRSNLPAMVEAARVCMKTGSYSLDAEFWRRASGKNVHSIETVVGIKGLPGRKGLGIGHRKSSGWTPDPDMKKLAEWIGDDARYYRPKRALVIGSGDRVAAELRKINRSDFDVVIGVNAAANAFGPVDYHVTLHGPEYADQKAAPLVTHQKCRGADIITPYAFRKGGESGSSGLFGVKFALVDLECDEVVLAGIGMDFAPHFNGDEIWTPQGFRGAWVNALPDLRGKVTSLGGWTAELLNGRMP